MCLKMLFTSYFADINDNVMKHALTTLALFIPRHLKIDDLHEAHNKLVDLLFSNISALLPLAV